MKTFIGVKKVEAVEMTRGDCNIYRGWKLPADECGDDPGYLVKYSDTYESWCPADNFENQNLPFHGSTTVTPADVDGFIDDVFYMTVGNKTTFVQVTLKNGFTLEESSSCVDPANYDEEVGKELCLEKIKNKVWFLLGFLLQSAKYGFNGGYK